MGSEDEVEQSRSRSVVKQTAGPDEQLFLEARASGELRADFDPHLNALALLGQCNSVIANRSLPRTASIDGIVEAYARIIIGGVVGDRTPPDSWQAAMLGNGSSHHTTMARSLHRKGRQASWYR